MPADPPLPTPADSESFLQRAELLADLGRYAESAEELSHAIAMDPAHAASLTLLSRVLLAEGRTPAALAAAQQAVAAQPQHVDALLARGRALAELDRRAEAARDADEVLRLAPQQAYAQTAAAAILADVRNGQPALNAAWNGVRLAPQQAVGHLVLGLVAARMQLFELAERAYSEALRLDPQLPEAHHDLGLVRLEQGRYHDALEALTEAIALQPEPGAHPAAGAGRRPARGLGDALRRVIQLGVGYALVAAILAACMAGLRAPGAQGWRLLAIGAAIGGLAGFGLAWSRMPKPARALLPDLLRADRPLAVAGGAAVAAFLLIGSFGVLGSPWLLAAAVAATAVAELAILQGYSR